MPRHCCVLMAIVTLSAATARAQPETPASEALVRGFVDAFNAHDVGRMRTFVAPGVKWMNVAGEKVSLETSGSKELAESMEKYFTSLPSARSSLKSVRADGAYVTTVEEASWESRSGPRRQCSVAVYEIADRRITNVWYFPAYRC